VSSGSPDEIETLGHHVEKSAAGSRPPSVSVGICAYTELDSTLRLVDEALAVHSPRFNVEEVIVATPNRAIVQQLKGKDPRVRVIAEERREGKVTALRKVLKAATSEIFIHISADVRLQPDAIPNLVQDLVDDPGCGAVVSHIKLVNRGGIVDRASVLIFTLFNNMNQMLNEEGKLGMLGDVYALRREAATVPPADVINEDAFIGLALRDMGYHIHKSKRAVVWIAGPRTPTDYIFQRTRILFGHLQLIGEHKEFPTTFEVTTPKSPVRNLKVLGKTLGELGPAYVPALGLAVILEVMCLGLAGASRAFHTSYKQWRVIQSTKQI